MKTVSFTRMEEGTTEDYLLLARLAYKSAGQLQRGRFNARQFRLLGIDGNAG